ncbi:MAG: TetR/AcrR family transcriptional regulator [Deltaproteobacteria bacterium]|nr:TetR/AcrR family transcriptional regulator [Deltaproteobacteria bacterium]
MSKRSQKKAENRSRLIRSAAVSFAAQGLKGANINHISLEAGLGKGTVYNYFASKEELFEAVLTLAGRELGRRLDEIETTTGPAAKRLKALASGLLAFYGEQPDLAKMLIRQAAAHRQEHQQALVSALEPFLTSTQEALSAGASRGEFRSDLDPFLSAVALWGMVNHQAAFHWLVSNRPLDPKGAAELVMTYFLDGVKG